MLISSCSDRVMAFAPAKLNLSLRVLGKRPDGYHELETLMVTINVYDTLNFAPAESLSLTSVDAHPARSGPPLEMSAGPDNLILRAATLLQSCTGTSQGAKITLAKRIPVAAGLAGGSSDAAVTLAALNRLWKLDLPVEKLRDLAAQLGSDVPFFLYGASAALCTGRGEIVRPIALAGPLHAVLVKPASGLSTAKVFQHCRPGEGGAPAQQLADQLARGRLDRAGRLLFNALQTPACELNADVARIQEVMSRQGLPGHLMSGSGTTYFGLCVHRDQAARLAGRLRALGLGDVRQAVCCP